MILLEMLALVMAGIKRHGTRRTSENWRRKKEALRTAFAKRQYYIMLDTKMLLCFAWVTVISPMSFVLFRPLAVIAIIPLVSCRNTRAFFSFEDL